MNRCAIAVLAGAGLLLAIPAAVAAPASTEVYEFDAVAECYVTIAEAPSCTLDVGKDDLARIWGDDVASDTIAAPLTHDLAEASKLGFDANVAAQFGQAHCTYRADVRIRARKGELEREFYGSYPHFKLVEVLSHKALEPECQVREHGT